LTYLRRLHAVRPAKDLSGDEADCGFQGRHKDKQKIKFKNEGDGYLKDVIVDEDGYAYVWQWRHEDVAVQHGLSPLHSRMLGLLDKIDASSQENDDQGNGKGGDQWRVVQQDNLYTDERYFSHSWDRRWMMAGVARKGKVPPCVEQHEVTKVDELAAAKGTVKAAHRVHKKGPGLREDMHDCDVVVLSFYDNKPVNMMSTSTEAVEWVKKQRKVYTALNGRHTVYFCRLNTIDDYNFGMGFVDVYDRLRTLYRPDRFARRQKWWHAIYWFLYYGALTCGYAVSHTHRLLYLRGTCTCVVCADSGVCCADV
jgi:hypothetical protein